MKTQQRQLTRRSHPGRRWLTAVFFLAIELTVLCVTPLYGQYKLCFPSTTWFGNPSGPNLSSLKVNDPGWLGAFRYVFGNGTSAQFAVVQGIRDSSNNLFFSFEGEGLSSLNQNTGVETTLVILTLDFRQTASDTGPLYRIVVHPVHNAPAAPPIDPSGITGAPSGPVTLSAGSTNSSGVVTWTAQSPTPSWLLAPNNQVGYWGSSGNYSWFLVTEIPHANLPVPTSFGLYINIFREVSGVYQESWWPPVAGLYEPGCPPGSAVPSSGCTPEGQTPNPGVPTALYQWGRATIDPAGVCGGVSLGSQVNDILTNNSPNSRICLQNNLTTADGTVCPLAPNVFTANVHNSTVNGSGTSQPAPNVRATFSIANFGLQSMWDPSQWTKVSVSQNPTAAVTLTAGAANTPLSTSSWFPVTPNASFYDPTTGHPHQCIMVQLDSTTGNVDFINNAAIQNMDFVRASKFTRTAEINGRGYPPRPDNADGTHNSDQLFDLHVLTSHEVLQGSDQARTPKDAASANEKNKVVSQLNWIAEGCRHTGRFMVVGDRKIELCDPVGAFGYAVRHTGDQPVEKWKLNFTGPGLKAIRGDPDTYQIRVPQNGIVDVTTEVEPKEDHGRIWCFGIGILATVLLILFYIKRRHRRRSDAQSAP